MHLVILICLYVVESARVLGLESVALVLSMTAKGHDCRHTLENSCLLENHTRSKSFRVDRSAKAHFSLDRCLPLWHLD